MVAQPRRIAAYGLYQRAKQTGAAGGKVGLRMGSDIRIEEPGTRLWYMTTGCEPPPFEPGTRWSPTPTCHPQLPPPPAHRLTPPSHRAPADLTRLASYHPEAIGECGVEFLVLDECHERSVEADLLALMARRLLARYPRLRVVLMSATMMVEVIDTPCTAVRGRVRVSSPEAEHPNPHPDPITLTLTSCTRSTLPRRWAWSRWARRCTWASSATPSPSPSSRR